MRSLRVAILERSHGDSAHIYGSLQMLVPEAHNIVGDAREGALSFGTTTPHQTYSSTNPPIHTRPIQTHSIRASTSLLFDTLSSLSTRQPHHISLNRRHGKHHHPSTTTLHMLTHLQDVDRYRIRSLQLRLLPRRPQLPGRIRHKSCRERRHRNRYPMQGWRSVGDGEAGLKQAHEEGRKQAHRDR
jgi:hypothetical protein